MLQLRRITDQVVDRGMAAADQLRGSLPEMRQRGNELARSAYDRSSEVSRRAYEYALNHRKATAAVLLGTGIAAALLWVINRNGGYQALRKSGDDLRVYAVPKSGSENCGVARGIFENLFDCTGLAESRCREKKPEVSSQFLR